MNTQETDPSEGRERGSALILTMGMLLLIMVFFMSFAIIAIYNRENVRVSESIIKARLQAETALQRTYAVLAAEWGNPYNANNAFPASKDAHNGFFKEADVTAASWQGRTYWASLGDNTNAQEALHTIMGGIDYTPASGTFLDSTIGWNDVKATGTDTIVARFIYLIIDESGKIDPTAIISKSSGEPVGGAGTRTGLDPTELSLYPLFTDDDGTVHSSIADIFQYNTQGGQLPETERWFSYYHIFKTNYTFFDGNTARQAKVLNDTVFPHSLDYEAFFDGYQDRHRFDLVNHDWTADSDTIASLMVEAPVFWNEFNEVTSATGGIPWLYNASDTEAAYQVAANLVDYCDANNTPTVDTQTPPRFVGLEKLPYINELIFSARVVTTSTGKYALELTCYPELVNMYDTASGLGAKLEVKVTVNIADPAVANAEVIFGDDSTDDPKYPAPTDPDTDELEVVANIPATSYSTAAAIPFKDTEWVDLGNIDTATDITITVNYMKLYDEASGHILDWACYSPSICPITTTVDTTSADFISIEVNDPRANLQADQWTWSGKWTALGAGTPGAVNSVCAPGIMTADVDYEDGAVEPWDVSTAYIRNGTMETMWEIGAIHRGRAWQSVNLTKYNSGAASPDGGMGGYALGDANILDQLKMNDLTETQGRVNINTHHRNVVRCLLDSVTVGGTYAAPTTGTKLNDIDNGLINNIIYAINTNQGWPWMYANGVDDATRDPFTNRGQLALVTAMTRGDGKNSFAMLDQDTDAKREEVIGKIVNLCTTRPNFFTAIVIAQVIQDFPTGIKGGTQGTYDEGIDRILAEQKIIAVLRRDAFTNRFSTVRYEYADE